MADVVETSHDRVLRYAAYLFAAALVFHNADHFRRGVDTITDQVLVAGTIGAILSVVAIVLVLMRHRLAPVVAVVVGFGMAVGVAASHLLPHWSSFSDSFGDGHASALTWSAGITEIVAAMVFGAAGLYALSASRTSARTR